MLQSGNINQEQGTQPLAAPPPNTYHICDPTTLAQFPSSLTTPATKLPSSLSDLSSSATFSPSPPSKNQPTVSNTPRSHLTDSISVSVDLEDQNPAIISSDIQSTSKEQSLNDIKSQWSDLIHELDCNVDPEAVVRRHISQLEKYHELKDIALGLVTMIADQRHLRTTDILEEIA